MEGYRRFGIQLDTDGPRLTPSYPAFSIRSAVDYARDAECHRVVHKELENGGVGLEGYVHRHTCTVPPVRGCSCGYYAYKTPAPVREAFWWSESGHTVLGFLAARVWGHGKVVEHARGWRAQRLRVEALSVPTCTCGRLLILARHLYPFEKLGAIQLVCPTVVTPQELPGEEGKAEEVRCLPR